MERTGQSWIAVIVSGAVAAGAGFVGGSWLTLRERSDLKTKVTQASLAESQSRRDLREAEERLRSVSDELSQAKSEVEILLARDFQPDAFAVPLEMPDAFHPPMVEELPEDQIKQRITELECEISSLKELVNTRHDSTFRSLSSSDAAPGVRLSDAAAAKPKIQCAAITQKGTRCSRPARSNGKCWQHGG